MKRLLKFLVGLGLGFGIGYALGSFVPSEVGAEWRQLIRQRAEEAIAEGRRAAAEKQRELEERLERSKQELAV